MSVYTWARCPPAPKTGGGGGSLQLLPLVLPPHRRLKRHSKAPFPDPPFLKTHCHLATAKRNLQLTGCQLRLEKMLYTKQTHWHKSCPVPFLISSLCCSLCDALQSLPEARWCQGWLQGDIHLALNGAHWGVCTLSVCSTYSQDGAKPQTCLGNGMKEAAGTQQVKRQEWFSILKDVFDMGVGILMLFVHFQSKKF